jgi:hypothetical protein
MPDTEKKEHRGEILPTEIVDSTHFPIATRALFVFYVMTVAKAISTNNFKIA